MGAVRAGLAVWPLIDSLNPSQDVLAFASVELDLVPIAIGQRVMVKWRGRPVFVVHRTEEGIARARKDDDLAGDVPGPTRNERQAATSIQYVRKASCKRTSQCDRS